MFVEHFLQGLKIDELYFEPPKNLGKAQIPGVQPGALLKLSQYGVNDAARQWYHAIKGILLRLGWESLTFELTSGEGVKVFRILGRLPDSAPCCCICFL